MKQLFIIGNWKSNKTLPDAINWLRFMKEKKSEIEHLRNKTIVICAPFTLLYTLHSFIKEYALPIKIGAQDISPFSSGAYTGEVNGEQIKEFAEYVIIGHSERRTYFKETDEMLEKKVVLANKSELKVIYCVPDNHSIIFPDVQIVAYEPVEAIGTGSPDSPDHAQSIAAVYTSKQAITTLVYGGSVTSENVHSFTSQPDISGVLPGGASLDAPEFLLLAQHA